MNPIRTIVRQPPTSDGPSHPQRYRIGFDYSTSLLHEAVACDEWPAGPERARDERVPKARCEEAGEDASDAGGRHTRKKSYTITADDTSRRPHPRGRTSNTGPRPSCIPGWVAGHP